MPKVGLLSWIGEEVFLGCVIRLQLICILFMFTV